MSTLKKDHTEFPYRDNFARILELPFPEIPRYKFESPLPG